jgi:DNA-binding HxlR family transcriptional regulator
MLLAPPLNVVILRALAEGSKPQAELQREAGLPPQTTLRAQLKRLVAVGAVEKRRRDRFPGVLEYELTASGEELLFAAGVLERWLGSAPGGPLLLGDNAAKAAIKALAEGWSTTMLRALAAGALSLTELDRIIASLSYPSLERRLSAMRLAGLVEPRPGNGRGTPYAVTEWARGGVAPLATAARWEQRHMAAAAAPIARLDVEAAFLLTAPLLTLPADLSGACRMAAEMPNGKARRLAGVTIAVERGSVVSCATDLSTGADAWALGVPTAWLSAVVEQDAERLELGGDRRLARLLVESLHGALFDARPERRP